MKENEKSVNRISILQFPSPPYLLRGPASCLAFIARSPKIVFATFPTFSDWKTQRRAVFVVDKKPQEFVSFPLLNTSHSEYVLSWLIFLFIWFWLRFYCQQDNQCAIVSAKPYPFERQIDDMEYFCKLSPELFTCATEWHSFAIMVQLFPWKFNNPLCRWGMTVSNSEKKVFLLFYSCRKNSK